MDSVRETFKSSIIYSCSQIEFGNIASCSRYFVPNLLQVALDSPLEACSVYLRHYEPYLKDPVGFPRVMVSTPPPPPA